MSKGLVDWIMNGEVFLYWDKWVKEVNGDRFDKER